MSAKPKLLGAEYQEIELSFMLVMVMIIVIVSLLNFKSDSLHRSL